MPNMIKNILFIMLGGAIGSTLRYLVGILCANSKLGNWPMGTFLVNIIGCLIMGILFGVGERFTSFPRELYLMLTVGLCGAFTTFSTFSADSIRLMETGQWFMALVYIVGSILVGFLLFFAGRMAILSLTN